MTYEKTASRSVPSWISEHWFSGIVGGLAAVDAVVLVICLGDLVHFWLTGLSTEVAWSLLQEKSRFEKWTEVLNALFTFGVFFIVLPAASAGLISASKHLASKDKSPGVQKETAPPGQMYVVSDKPVTIRGLLFRRIGRFLVRPGRGILYFHIFAAAVIACFTIWMRSAVVLEGNDYSTDSAPHPAFFSVWMSIVSVWKVITPAVLFPVVRKYFIRMFGGEHPHIFHVFSEVFTEDVGIKE